MIINFKFYSYEFETDDTPLVPLFSAFLSVLNVVRQADQQIQSALETSVLNAQQNKVKLKIVLFIIIARI